MTRLDEPPKPKQPDPVNDSDDDDISLVSRSPSPVPMDIDDGISKYDEYHRGVEREVITVETRIKSTNKGFAMLAKLGWVEGQPLGLSSDGRVEPIPFYVKNDLTGLGKTSQDVRMIETTVAQRRGLDSERQQKETEDQRKAREDHVARRTALQSEISSTLRPFYCSLCDKQFKTVTQYDEHTNSYAHHHKARIKDMQANARIVPKEELDKRKEKERKREERELRKIAAANGIKMPKPSASVATAPLASSLGSMALVESAVPCDVPKTSGSWMSVSAASSLSSGQVQAQQPSGFKRSGWSTVGGPSSPSTTPPPPSSAPPPPPPSDAPPLPEPPSSGGDWQRVPSPPLKPCAPVFRTGGWTSLSDDSLSVTASTPPPPPPSVRPQLPSPPRITPQTTSPSSHTSILAPVPAAQPVRSGWQQFKHSGPKRR